MTSAPERINAVHVARAVDGPVPGADRIRVAPCQYGVGTDVDVKLATALSFIDQAAAEGAIVIVLPEFGNRVSWYEDRAFHWC